MTRCCGYVKLASLFALIACLILSVSCQIPAPPPGKPCPSVIDRPSCVCNHPNGSGVIDVTSLGSKGDARFLIATLKQLYSDHPGNGDTPTLRTPK